MRMRLRAMVVIAIWGCAALAFAADKTVKIATGEWAPYTSESLPGYGLAAEIVTAAFHEVGYKSEFSWLPWERCEESLLAGEHFGAIPYVKTPERSAKFDWTDQIFETQDKFFFNKTRNPQLAKLEYKSLAGLKSFRVVGLNGYHYMQSFQQAGLNIEWAASEESALEMLERGRVDLYLNTETLFYDLVNKKMPGKRGLFSAMEPSYSKDLNYIMVSRTYKDAAKIRLEFNRGLKIITANGVLKKIQEKYSGRT